MVASCSALTPDKVHRLMFITFLWFLAFSTYLHVSRYVVQYHTKCWYVVTQRAIAVKRSVSGLGGGGGCSLASPT